MIATAPTRKLILDGGLLYESLSGSPAKLLGPFQLAEGQRSERMTIIERIVGDLRVVPPSEYDGLVLERSLQEKVGSKRILLVLEGLFQRADHKNANSRIYPETIWDSVFAPDSEILRRVEVGEMLGECDHPKDGETLLMRVAGATVKLWRDENDRKRIMGRMVIFDTPQGRQVEAIHAGGGRIGVSSRGQGSVVRMGGADVVQSDFILETWDAVHNPSTPGAYPEVHRPEDVSESRTQETQTMSVTAPAPTSLLRERFEKLKAYKLEALSKDALVLVKENISDFRRSLRTAPQAEAVDLSPDAAILAEKVDRRLEAISDEPQIKGGKPAKNDATDAIADLVAKTPSGLSSTEGPTTEAEEKDDEDAPPFMERASTADDVVSVLEMKAAEIVKHAGKWSVPALTRAVCESYRKATQASGPFTTVELDGIARFVHKIGEKAKKAGPAVQESKKTAPSGDLPSLYETQVQRTTAALAEAARAKSQLTEMSAKHAASLQIIEALTKRCKSYKTALEKAQSEVSAAGKLVASLAEDIDTESLSAVQEALRKTHPHVRGLSDSLRRSRSLDEAVSVVNRGVLESLPSVEREPVNEARRRAVAASALAEQKNEAARAAREMESRPSRPSAAPIGVVERTASVVKALRLKGQGR